ncbi:MAG: hypothetical protein RMI91_11440 [Gemmatales bacterium]|nr:hypothetical protein [Gemmatales bacterium]MDW7995257.1 hypothetical protein [Gemmatales bacterium]
MALTEAVVRAIIADTSKLIVGDIDWQLDPDHAPSVEFVRRISSRNNWALVVRGSYNPRIGTLSYAILLKPYGRVYALDMGRDHHNPDCQRVGEKHKHVWTERYRDRQAYSATDITAPSTDPVAVWQQFCQEACVRHEGVLRPVPSQQLDLYS